jgi:hypothetical protein
MRTSHTTLSPDDLSFVADALLALCERGSERPWYSEEGMRVKLKLAERREPQFGHLVRQTDGDPLLSRECHDVFCRAGLTRRQSVVLLQRLEGWTFEEIGRAVGGSKQGAQHVFVQAVKKIARACRVYPFKGLSEVYRWETRRGLRRSGLGRIPLSAT